MLISTIGLMSYQDFDFSSTRKQQGGTKNIGNDAMSPADRFRNRSLPIETQRPPSASSLDRTEQMLKQANSSREVFYEPDGDRGAVRSSRDGGYPHGYEFQHPQGEFNARPLYTAAVPKAPQPPLYSVGFEAEQKPYEWPQKLRSESPSPVKNGPWDQEGFHTTHQVTDGIWHRSSSRSNSRGKKDWDSSPNASPPRSRPTQGDDSPSRSVADKNAEAVAKHVKRISKSRDGTTFTEAGELYDDTPNEYTHPTYEFQEQDTAKNTHQQREVDLRLMHGGSSDGTIPPHGQPIIWSQSSPARSRLSHYIVISLYRYLVISLSRYIGISLSHYLIISLSSYPIIS